MAHAKACPSLRLIMCISECTTSFTNILVLLLHCTCRCPRNLNLCLIVYTCLHGRWQDLNRRTYEDVVGVLGQLPLKVQHASTAQEFQHPKLTPDLWRKLKAALPNSTHFKIAEARLLLQKL